MQVGNDPTSSQFLQELDNSLHKTHQIRDIVDTAPSAALGGHLSADNIIKVLLGGISRRHDKKDVLLKV